jgi:hypothetical protein
MKNVTIMNIKHTKTLFWNQYWKTFLEKNDTNNSEKHDQSITPNKTDSVLELGCGLFPHVKSSVWGQNWYVMDTSPLVKEKLSDKGIIPKSNIISGFFPIDSPDEKRYDTIIVHDIFKDMNRELITLTVREIRDILSTNGFVLISPEVYERYTEISSILEKHFIQNKERGIALWNWLFGTNKKKFFLLRKNEG